MISLGQLCPTDMLNFSYSIAPQQKKDLEDIEAIRNKILLQLISPKDEIRLRWEVSLERIRATLRLSKIDLTLKDLAQAISSDGKKRIDPRWQEALGYKKANSYIQENWILNPRPVTVPTLDQLYSSIKSAKINLDYKGTKQMLDFIQVNPPEHPVVQAGIAFVAISNLLPHQANNPKYPLLTSLIFLYKYGFDFRGMLNIEEFIENDATHFNDILNGSRTSGNISDFLEYFISAVVIQADKGLRKIKGREFITSIPESFYDLSKRQIEILTLLEQPGAQITNKVVQKRFSVSQITASRDLARLASLGILSSHGKGRSIHYTRAR